MRIVFVPAARFLGGQPFVSLRFRTDPLPGGLEPSFPRWYSDALKTCGSYQVPLIPMALFPGAGAFLWLSIDPSEKLYSPQKQEPVLTIS